MDAKQMKKTAGAEAWRVVRRKPTFSLLTIGVFVVGFILRGCVPF